jgi:hypothetical protein
LEAGAGVKPRSPKGRAAARGLDARRRLQHAFMRAGDASPKTAQAEKNPLDSDHGIYRKPGPVRDVTPTAIRSGGHQGYSGRDQKNLGVAPIKWYCTTLRDGVRCMGA